MGDCRRNAAHFQWIEGARGQESTGVQRIITIYCPSSYIGETARDREQFKSVSRVWTRGAAMFAAYCYMDLINSWSVASVHSANSLSFSNWAQPPLSYNRPPSDSCRARTYMYIHMYQLVHTCVPVLKVFFCVECAFVPCPRCCCVTFIVISVDKSDFVCEYEDDYL